MRVALVLLHPLVTTTSRPSLATLICDYAGSTMQIFVKTLTGKTITLEVESSDTIGERLDQQQEAGSLHSSTIRCCLAAFMWCLPLITSRPVHLCTAENVKAKIQDKEGELQAFSASAIATRLLIAAGTVYSLGAPWTTPPP